MDALCYGTVYIRKLRNPLLHIVTMFRRIGVWRARSSDKRLIWLYDEMKLSACLALRLSGVMIMDAVARSYQASSMIGPVTGWIPKNMCAEIYCSQ